MLTAITGVPGSGKTQLAVKKLLEYHQANQALPPDDQRPIYSNIKGLKLPHAVSPDDWRECPDNSVIFYDECQEYDIFAKTKRGSRSESEIIQALETHRHRGIDIYFITQDISYLCAHLRGLIGLHYHVTRPMGANVASVFVWRHGKTSSPELARTQAGAEDKFLFNYSKKLYNLYNSATVHTHKMKIPKRVIFWVLLPLLLIGGAYYQATKSSTKEFYGIKDKEEKTLDQASKDFATGEAIQQEQPPKPEKTQLISYNVNDPYQIDNSKFNRQVVNYPDFAGCIQFDNNCSCYTQQGTKLDVDAKICKQGLKELPFNYFNNTRQQDFQTRSPALTGGTEVSAGNDSRI